MPLFGKVDQANNAPINVVDDKNHTGQNLYANTTATTSTVFGADTTEVGVMTKKIAHAGWQLRRRGTGALVSLAITGGTGYANGDTWTIGGAVTGANASGNLSTNATGGITSTVISTAGGTYYGTETVTITTSGGTTGVLTPTFGGRANRVHFETLVAMGSMTGDGSDDSDLPDA